MSDCPLCRAIFMQHVREISRVTPQPEPTPEPVIARYVGLFSCNHSTMQMQSSTAHWSNDCPLCRAIFMQLLKQEPYCRKE